MNKDKLSTALKPFSSFLTGPLYHRSGSVLFVSAPLMHAAFGVFYNPKQVVIVDGYVAVDARLANEALDNATQMVLHATGKDVTVAGKALKLALRLQLEA